MKVIKFKQFVNEGVNVVPIGKTELIQELRNKLINFEKKNEFDAMAIARLIYNDCADFMNKESIYSDKAKYGEPVAKPAAQSAPTDVNALSGYEQKMQQYQKNDVNALSGYEKKMQQYQKK